MRVINVHERSYPVEPAALGRLLETLASKDDRLWPGDMWPRMRLDRPLGVGARGGHGPIGYTVDACEAGRMVRFRFTRPRGFDGCHWLEVLPAEGGRARLRHTIEVQTRGIARLSWPLAIRPLHDALLEDALARAEASLGIVPMVTPWPWHVRLLRWLLTRGQATAQRTPQPVAGDGMPQGSVAPPISTGRAVRHGDSAA